MLRKFWEFREIRSASENEPNRQGYFLSSDFVVDSELFVDSDDELFVDSDDLEELSEEDPLRA